MLKNIETITTIISNVLSIISLGFCLFTIRMTLKDKAKEALKKL